jgi:hypothetical protein
MLLSHTQILLLYNNTQTKEIMRVATNVLAAIVAATAVVCSQAFSPTSFTTTPRQSTIVQDTIRSQWTMMPDEPTPEVSTSTWHSQKIPFRRRSTVVVLVLWGGLLSLAKLYEG